MTLNELINKASAAYSDGLIAVEYWDFKRECPRRNPKGGDTLALFIATEIADTYDPEATDEKQINEVLRVLSMAKDDLESVREAFTRLLRVRDRKEGG
jgi:hypothetical protein